MGRSLVGSLMSAALVSIVVFAGASTSVADEADPGKRFMHRAVRIESPVGAVVYRLDVYTGEVCAFGFERQGEPQPHGCLGASAETSRNRYRLDAASGTRGTSQSWAFRLDRFSGEVCRFRLVLGAIPRLEQVGCVGTGG
jgi:hypothetical protein